MDYNRWDTTSYGPDGCIDETHPANNGLESIWCPNCALTQLYNGKYSRLSRADFWIASSNAVIRQTSLRNSLDLKTTFTWGREDRNSCPGSGQRLPTPEGCDQVEGVFLDRMGLEWADAVALLGAHTLGRGDRAFSGHHGAWVSSDSDAQVFDKVIEPKLHDNSLHTSAPRLTQPLWLRLTLRTCKIPRLGLFELFSNSSFSLTRIIETTIQVFRVVATKGHGLGQPRLDHRETRII